jgi:hypothetical protein
MADTKTLLYATFAGAATGAVAWFLLRPIVDKGIESSLRTQLERQIPEQLNRELDSKLRQYGFTPETGQQIARLLATLDRTGIL